MFKSYLQLGFEHILDSNGLDHVLFILVLTVPFLIKDWKKVFWLATAFTIGHSITLALAGLNIITINSALVEILIAITIFITAIFNLINVSTSQMKARYSSALIFGLIHGMGFSNFFRSIVGKDELVFPLFAFNVGVELAQLVIVAVTLLISFLLVQQLKFSQKHWIWSVSLAVLFLALRMILDRI